MCGSAGDGRVLERYDAAQAAAHFCPPWRDADRYLRLQAAIRRLWEGDACEIHRCPSCGFGFAVPYVGGDEQYYAILHEQHGYPMWRWDYDVALGVVGPSGGGLALDIGAGTGAFLRALGPGWSRCAVEGSETTRAILRQSGITVFADLAEAAARSLHSFQLVTLFQVLEHIADFRTVLSRCRELIAPGGTLVITVPDCDAMLAQPSLTGEHDMPPNHVGKWTARSLALALEAAGFEATHSVFEPSSWKQTTTHIYGRVRTDGQKPGTLAAAAYRIRRRAARIPLLALAGALAAPRLLPRWRELRRGGAFATIARPLGSGG
ncbi:MAG: class I SAM-dependent methyltransferase [Gemmatimonadaceae bacterium]